MTDILQEHFDNISERYRGVPETWRSVYDKARRLVEPLVRDKVLLDVGNGGTFCYDTRLPKKVIVLDISPKMLETIHDPSVEKRIGDARTLEGVQPDSVDAVLYLMVLHHLNGKDVRGSRSVMEQVLSAAYSRLRPGGVLLAVEPVFPAFLYYPQAIFFGLAKGFLAGRGVSMVFFYRRRQLCRMISGVFKCAEENIEAISLPVTGSVDPMGGTFPGRFRIPAWLLPTRYFLFKAVK